MESNFCLMNALQQINEQIARETFVRPSESDLINNAPFGESLEDLDEEIAQLNEQIARETFVRPGESDLQARLTQVQQENDQLRRKLNQLQNRNTNL